MPKKLGAIKADAALEIKMAIRHLEGGHFTKPAPQRLNSENDIIGLTHFVIENLSSVTSTDPSDPSNFAFFATVNTAAADEGNVSVNVTNGLLQACTRFLPSTPRRTMPLPWLPLPNTARWAIKSTYVPVFYTAT
jgi:hypothetical protein